MFTSLLESTNEKNYSKYIKSPECNNIHQPYHNYFNTNKIIDIENNTWKPLKDPFYKHSKPTDNYSILYPDIFQENFIKQHKKAIKNDSRF